MDEIEAARIYGRRARELTDENERLKAELKRLKENTWFRRTQNCEKELAQARERIAELEEDLHSVMDSLDKTAEQKIKAEAEFPPDDRACAYGCGPCRWEPGPWHAKGCPSWRKEAADVRLEND